MVPISVFKRKEKKKGKKKGQDIPINCQKIKISEIKKFFLFPQIRIGFGSLQEEKTQKSMTKNQTAVK